MDIGETISINIDPARKDKCIICDKNHKKKKKIIIQEIAPKKPKKEWGRISMSDVWDLSGKRASIYKNNAKPTYSTQGHHCLALSALVENANAKVDSSRKDRFLRLNFFLDQVGYSPNRPSNTIHLPSRTGWGKFDEYFKALDLDAPLQMHGPGHDEDYFIQCDWMLSSLIFVITDTDYCEETDYDDWLNDLEELIEKIENYAFNSLAKNEAAWCLHKEEQTLANKLYFLPTNKQMEVYGKDKKKEMRNGMGKTKKTIKFPDPGLDTTPFE